MGRTVFTNTESIMAPNKFHRYLHQSCHTNSRLHIVGEYKESTHCCDHTAVKHHTYTHTAHSEFGYTSLEESSTEIATCERVGLIKEAIGFVRVAKVGRCHNHIRHLFCQYP